MLLGNALSIVAESGLGQLDELGQVEGYDLLGILMAGSIGIAGNVIGIVVGALIIYAAVQMMSLRSWGLCLAAAILALIPCIGPCCCLSLPFGIWAIVVLLDDRVRAAFV
jgi:hypothetical protein